ncbi:MAG: SHOCT domain-containing protein, partial [Alphaproteobacteria bacterium]
LIKGLVEQSKNRGGEEKSALDIAKERYARGEITKEEFEEIKKSLQ